VGSRGRRGGPDASDESVDPSEIERMIVAQALLIQRLADQSA
jgi:hypothetical protein